MNPPKKVTLLVSLILAVVAVLSFLGIIPVGFLKNNAFWVAVAGYALLFLGCVFKGL